jgi:hypothetical protein
MRAQLHVAQGCNPMCPRLQASCVQVIQRVVRSRFPDSTILTIAHRLDTVIDYDHLLLMAEGRVAEARPTNTMCSVHVQRACAACMCSVHVQRACAACMCSVHVQHACAACMRSMCGVHTVAHTVAARQAVHITCAANPLRLCLGGSPRRAARTARLALLGPRRQRPGRGAAACHRRGVSVQRAQQCAKDKVGRPCAKVSFQLSKTQIR